MIKQTSKSTARVWYSDWARFGTVLLTPETCRELETLVKVDGVYLATHPNDYNNLRPFELDPRPGSQEVTP